MYMLDSNICIYLIKSKNKILIDKIAKVNKKDIFISTIVISELETGAKLSNFFDVDRFKLNQFLSAFNICDYNYNAAEKYGEIRSKLINKNLEKQVGALDLLIAAHAMSLNLTLITNNIRDYKNIYGLKLKDWSKI